LAEPTDRPRPFDVRTIRILVRLMSEHDLSEIDLSEGDQRIRLRRGARVVAAPPVPAPVPAPPSSVVPAQSVRAPAADEHKPAKKLVEIKSPTVGVFFAQREPGAPPFVTVGSRVTPTTVVGLIEAMKVYSDIQAGCTGVVTEVCVENKEPVEYNTVLFRIDPTA
jgi:acetyl-CoA carboxylase biotin carboxyl carrier protein